MKKRLIYPGRLQIPEIILVSGAINTFFLSEAMEALALGVRSRGYSCRTCCPGMVRSYDKSEQSGDPATFDMSSEVTLVNMGEYLGGARFRQGPLPEFPYSRCVFFSPLADPVMAMQDRFPWEQARIDEVQDHLSEQLGMPVHLAPSSLIRPAGTQQLLMETLDEVLYYTHNGLPVPTELQQRREAWQNTDGLDQLPALERAVW